MFRLLIVFAMVINLAFAKSRFSEVEKKSYLDDVKTALIEHKKENNGEISPSKLKEDFIDSGAGLVEANKISNVEFERIKKDFEELVKSNPDKITEEKMLSFFEREFDDLNKIENKKAIKEGEICNESIPCADGMVCAPGNKQNEGGSCKKFMQECKEDKDCCSKSCTLNESIKKKVCAPINRCYFPVKLGQSCNENPICGEGLCLEVSSGTLNIGECVKAHNKCKSNSECCSGECDRGLCKQNFICKDCIRNGGKVENGKRCCEGLIKSINGICIPDMPPVEIPQVNNSTNKFLKTFIGLFVESASAAEKTIRDGVAYEVMRKSNYETCDIHFKDDFFSYLKIEKQFDLELAMLAFDYVYSGESSNDYWTVNKSAPETSINGRMKSIALAHREDRKKMNENMDKINLKLTCMCLDVKGYSKITDGAKKKFFETSCPAQYAKYKDQPVDSADNELNGDASSLKAKRFMVQWSTELKNFNANLRNDNHALYEKIAAVRDWVLSTNWAQGERKETYLYHYTIRKLSMLAALFVGILTLGTMLVAIWFGGGFGGTYSSAFMTAMTAITVGFSAQWSADSLTAAWQNNPPHIHDDRTRSRNCGPRLARWLYKCEEHDVYLNHPQNNICGIHSYSNGCIKNFLAVYDPIGNTSQKPTYLIDPGVPVGVPREKILKNINPNRNYAETLDDNFMIAKAYLTNGSKNPGIDSNGYAQFGIRFNHPEDFVLTSDVANIVKEAAKKFAVSEKMMEESDTENLQAFAEYAYQFHFLQPKQSSESSLGYPLPGLHPYLDYMSDGVMLQMVIGGIRAGAAFEDLNRRYIADLNTTEEVLNNNISALSPSDQTALKASLDSNKSALNSAIAFQNYLNSDQFKNAQTFDQISSAGKNFASKNNTTFSSDQMDQLRAIATVRQARAAKQKVINNYKAAIAERGDTARDAQIKEASLKYSSAISSPLSKSSGSRSWGENKLASNSTVDAALSKTTGASEKIKSSTNKLDHSSNLNYSSGSSLSSVLSSSANNKSSDSSSKDEMPTNEDESKVLEAINARNKQISDKYSSKETHTLFEKVTNAYIRNYDKVLTKKKTINENDKN